MSAGYRSYQLFDFCAVYSRYLKKQLLFNHKDTFTDVFLLVILYWSNMHKYILFIVSGSMISRTRGTATSGGFRRGWFARWRRLFRRWCRLLRLVRSAGVRFALRWASRWRQTSTSFIRFCFWCVFLRTLQSTRFISTWTAQAIVTTVHI